MAAPVLVIVPALRDKSGLETPIVGRMTRDKKVQLASGDPQAVYLRSIDWIGPEGTLAIFPVKGVETQSTGWPKLETTGPGRPAPLEIIRVDATSTDRERARALMCEGVRLQHEPADELLVMFNDGAVAGPIVCSRQRTAGFRAFFCDDDSFDRPFPYWADASKLEPFSLTIAGNTRSFTSFVELPQPDSIVDFFHFGRVLRHVLEYAQQSSNNLTDDQVAQITRALRAPDTPELVARHADWIIEVLSSASISADYVRTFAREVADFEPFKSELANLRTRAMEDALLQSRKAEQEVLQRIDLLESERSKLAASVSDMDRDVRRRERLMLNEVMNRVETRVLQVQEEASEVVASIALLRPFLGTPGGRIRVGQISESYLSNAVNADDVSAAITQLAHNLQHNGFERRVAVTVAAEVLAALVVGCAVTFTGSLASRAARVCAITLGAGSATVIRIPIGLLDDEQFASRYVAKDVSGLRILIVEGLNRSAPEAYADMLRTDVINALFATSPERTQAVFITLETGPSALDASMYVSELGPLIDTDAIPLSSRKTNEPPRGLSIEHATWIAWMRQAIQRSVMSADLKEALNVVDRRNTVWHRTVRMCYERLAEHESASTFSAEQSIVTDWLIPRALSMGRDPSEVVEILGISAESEETDPRLRLIVAQAPK